MIFSLLSKLLGNGGTRLDDAQLADRAAVLAHPTYEIVPLKSVDQAIADLPAASDVTITCSPVKGIDTTLDLCESTLALGHTVTPHLAARMVESADHFGRIVDRLEALGLTSVFVIAGDGDDPLGPYADSPSLIEDLLDRAPFLEHVGFGSYPDGHAFIDDDALHDALHRKQALLREAGVSGHASTQMCFDTAAIGRWIEAERAAGFDLPIHLGVAGVVDRARLLSMGMRLGVGTSLRYLSKNRGALTRLMTSTSYEPTDILDGLAGNLAGLGVEGLHLYTFNQVGSTAEWMAEQH